ncbi:hypothetical protein HU200_045215 [Digitaria exilis]|uniref:Uncharacterized protein n=1 Tax=Digitaria exilis TaxID=1010633 RepID=A0A835EFR7_9POAL|nr:hypothetical protein HU200_045215 [Digitaria exilis]
MDPHSLRPPARHRRRRKGDQTVVDWVAAAAAAPPGCGRPSATLSALPAAPSTSRFLSLRRLATPPKPDGYGFGSSFVSVGAGAGAGAGTIRSSIAAHAPLVPLRWRRARIAMASVGKKRGVPALGWWLMVVGTVRLAFTCSCFFGSAALCSTTYSKAQTTSMGVRSGCERCCRSRPIYTATFLSLVYAYGHFIFEYLQLSRGSDSSQVYTRGGFTSRRRAKRRNPRMLLGVRRPPVTAAHCVSLASHCLPVSSRVHLPLRCSLTALQRPRSHRLLHDLLGHRVLFCRHRASLHAPLPPPSPPPDGLASPEAVEGGLVEEQLSMLVGGPRPALASGLGKPGHNGG